ncbi:hypothetical protein GCM10020220_099590 [Nonomuraea rubra]|uniref:hypothetical protein n=1 Tax=Nonomuraea rubra TaxID=46180 RepID=UPI0031EF94A7
MARRATSYAIWCMSSDNIDCPRFQYAHAIISGSADSSAKRIARSAARCARSTRRRCLSTPLASRYASVATLYDRCVRSRARLSASVTSDGSAAMRIE